MSCQDHSPESSPEPTPPSSLGQSTQGATLHGRRGRRGRGQGGSASSRRATTHAVEEQEWCSTLSDVVVEPFERETGPTIPISASPLEMFLSFFTPELIHHICNETNRYAAACLSASSSSGSEAEWSTIDEEIKAYLGFTILMGITKLPDLYD